MRRILWMAMVAVVVAATASACGGRESSTTGELDITFASEPDPPVTGENTFVVTVQQADGAPVTDASVTTEFFMPAMPSMKMPEMRTTTPLTHEGNGRYRGRGQVQMAGGWDVTVTVARNGQTVATEKLTVTAK